MAEKTINEATMTMGVPTAEENEDPVWTSRCAVQNRAWVQVRYHRRRQRFFDLADKLTKTVTIVIGGSLLGQAMKDKVPEAASVISGVGLLSLIFGYGDRKQTHKELAEQAAVLVGEIEKIPSAQLTDEKCAQWSAEYLRMAAKAPPPLKTLTIICEHEQAAADGHPNHVKLPWFLRRWLSHFIS